MIGLIAGVFACLLLGLLIDRTAPLLANNEFADAQTRWEARPFSNYHLVLAEDGRNCFQSVLVKDEEIVKILQNNCRVRPRTITSLFTLIDLNAPTVYRCVDFRCACDTIMSRQVVYDPQLGYPHEVGFNWYVKTNWFHPDYWQIALATRSLPICRNTTFSRKVTVVSLTPMP